MKTLIRLAWRNIWRSKRRSLISMASVLFAVLFAISADSFERGSYELMISNLVKFSTGYIQIQDVLYEEESSINNAMLFDDSLQEVLQEFSEEIDYTIPRIQSFALAATSVKTRGAYLMGIDPDLENRFNGLSDNLVEGEYFHPNDQSVMLSSGLANILGLEIGDTLALIGQGFQGANASGLYPVKGIIKLSIPEMNNNTIYMPLPAAQYFFDAQDRVTSLIVMPTNTSKSGALTDDLNERLDHEWYTALHWEHMLKDMLRLMEMDSAGSKMIIYILYIVIGFGLFGTILTMMLERMKEFAMLVAIGMKRFQLAAVCMLESVMLSFVGVLAGSLLILPVILYFNRFPIQLTGEMADMIQEYGFEAVIPTSVDPQIFISQALAIFIIALLIGLYPVFKVFKLKVVPNQK